MATTAVLWRFFPVGPKFWFVLVFLNWGGHGFIKFQKYILQGKPVLETTLMVSVIVLALALVGLLYWIFVRATTRVQRLWGAVFIWSAVSIIFFILR